MFENIFSNFKSKSSKVSDSVSVKGTGARFSESLSQIRCNLMNKTNSLSSYFTNIHSRNDSSSNRLNTNDNFTSKPGFNNKSNNFDKSTFLHCNRVEYVHFNPLADSEDSFDLDESSIVDRFVRVINIDEDRQSLNRKYSFRVSRMRPLVL